MAYSIYTNEASFRDAWSDKELDTLKSGGNANSADSDSKFEKATKTAAAYIDDYLRQGGYTLPLLFTEYNEIIPAAPLDYDYLYSTLQQASDCLTAFFLASGNDKNKKTYTDCKTAQDKYLKDVGLGKIILPYPRDEVAQQGFSVVSRPQVMVRSHVDDRFPYATYNRSGLYYNDQEDPGV